MKTKADKIARLYQKAMKYSIWEDCNTDYYDKPSVVGFTTKGLRLIRRAERLEGTPRY
jgi:hypothetical protein